MKTKYRFIHFELISGVWLCYANTLPKGVRPAIALGFCEYYAPWKQWQFVPAGDTAFTSDCCRDIADFLGQLKT